MMCVYYFIELDQPVFEFAPVHRFLFQGPSESCMMIPGSYAEMMKDYE